MSVIVLCGGGINYKNLPIAITASNSMIPINGKPVIGWVLDDLLEKALTRIILVLQRKNVKLFEFVSWAYAKRCELIFAYVDESGSILDSVLAGLDFVTDRGPVHIVLGDTLIRDPYNFKTDTIYSGEYENPENWCLVEVDNSGKACRFYDKSGVKEPNLEAVAGYYFLTNVDAFKTAVRDARNNSGREISKALDLYKKKYPLSVVKSSNWYDFGHLDHLITAKKRLLQTRYFNSLIVDDRRGVVTKTSVNGDKLKDELNWYKSLPPSLAILTPRLVEEVNEDGIIKISQELYGYPNLAELYVFGELDFDFWTRAVDRLIDVHDLMRQFTKTGSIEDLRAMYIEKTFQRQEEFLLQAPMSVMPQIRINDKTYDSPSRVLKENAKLLEGLCDNQEFTIIHGDYCFSNILYDLQTEVIRLIDPRGSFGKKGIYGDPRYDMGKLRHSVSGLYDFIVGDLFELTEKENGFCFRLYNNQSSEALAQYLDKKLEDAGYKILEIKLIEALLFLSMLPLHKEKPHRQKAMYLQGTILLNEVLHENRN
jgi:dTDP-glucose pyrophosphorylase